MARKVIYLMCLGMICLIISGCDDDNRSTILEAQAQIATKHLEHHRVNGYDFSKPCSGCGSAIMTPIAKQSSGFHMAPVVVASTMNRRRCRGRC